MCFLHSTCQVGNKRYNILATLQPYFFFLHCQTKTQNVRTRVVCSGVTVKPGLKKLEVQVKVSIEIKNKVVGNFLQYLSLIFLETVSFISHEMLMKKRP